MAMLRAARIGKLRQRRYSVLCHQGLSGVNEGDGRMQLGVLTCTLSTTRSKASCPYFVARREQQVLCRPQRYLAGVQQLQRERVMLTTSQTGAPPSAQNPDPRTLIPTKDAHLSLRNAARIIRSNSGVIVDMW
eukprot:2104009-Rhodomonas_salina.1